MKKDFFAKNDLIFYSIFFFIASFLVFKLLIKKIHIDIKRNFQTRIINGMDYIANDAITSNKKMKLLSKKVISKSNVLNFFNNNLSLILINDRVYSGDINFIEEAEDLFFVKEKFILRYDIKHFLSTEELTYDAKENILETKKRLTLNDPEIFIDGFNVKIVDKNFDIKNNSNILIKRSNKDGDLALNSIRSHFDYENRYIELLENAHIFDLSNSLKGEYVKIFLIKNNHKFLPEKLFALKNVEVRNQDYTARSLVFYQNNRSFVKILYGDVEIDTKDGKKTQGEAYYCNDKENFCLISSINQLIKNYTTKNETIEMLKFLKKANFKIKDNIPSNDDYITIEMQ